MAIVKCHSFLVSALTNSRAPLKMTVSQQNPTSYIASPISALLYGLTFCISECHSSVTTYIVGKENIIREGVVGTSNCKPKNWLKIGKVF